MDREWPGVIRIHPIEAMGGHGALAIPAPRAVTLRWHDPDQQALAEGATPMINGQPQMLRTALALLLGPESGLQLQRQPPPNAPGQVLPALSAISWWVWWWVFPPISALSTNGGIAIGKSRR